MKYFVERTCTVVRGRAEDDGGGSESHPLESFRQKQAYVLLGPPGAGKTKAFEREAKEEGVEPITARDFQALDPEPELENATLYIDGLDETRAGATDGRTPFDAIRRKLQRIGRPRFRLSCREADWFGANDRERLKAVSPDGKVQVLRLEPMSEEGILENLDRNLGVEDPKAFVTEARRQGVEGLLGNPQSLRMLVAAVDDQAWPKTKTETFDLACRKLIEEHNQEHRIAPPESHDIESLVHEAGHLCALLLLSGKSGLTLPGTPPKRDYLGIEHVRFGDPQLGRGVVRRAVFASPEEGRVAPDHRQTAEFLAARYLAKLIADGLPVRRVLALMTGFDGAVLSELRGLAAWLAVHNRSARIEIIERDPLGVVLYGDIQNFSPHEKTLVFDYLCREVRQHPWLLGDPSTGFHLGGLVVSELENRFRGALAEAPTDEADKAIGRMVIRMFEHAQAPPGFEADLLSVVRDSGWSPVARYGALDLYVQTQTQDQGAADTLLALLHNLYHKENDRVVRNELSGRLLHALYPSRMSVEQVARYLRHPLSDALYDSYTRFWVSAIIERSTSDQLIALLGILRERIRHTPSPGNPGPDGVDYPDALPGACLNAILVRSPTEVRPSLVYYWLGVSQWIPLLPLDTDVVLRYLSRHAGFRQSLIRIAHDDEDIHRARAIVWIVLQAGHEPDEVPSHLQLLSDRRPTNPSDNTVADPQYGAGRFQRRQSDPQFELHMHKCRDYLRSNLQAVRENRGSPAMLHNLATAYLGGFVELWAPTARERLLRMLDYDEELVDSALLGLAGAVVRPDLPTPGELIRFKSGGQLHLLAYPVMAGMRERNKAGYPQVPPLEDRHARIALTLWHTTGEPPRLRPRTSSGVPTRHDDLDGSPEWPNSLVESRPELAAGVLVSVSRALLRSGRVPKDGYYDLAYPKDNPRFTRLAALRLLEVFPVRCPNPLLPHLRNLLVAACLHCNGPSLLEIIERKLQYRSMNAGQRVYWLTAGHLVAPEEYAQLLGSFASGNERRLRHLITMVAGRGGLPLQLRDTWDVAVIAPLIRVLGRFLGPTPELHPGVAYRVTLEMEAADFVAELINRLVQIPSEGSTDSLVQLLDAESLRPWAAELSAAAHRQRGLRREADFRHPSLELVSQVLENHRLANAADLASFTNDILATIARDIRDGANSNWRLFWNVDSNNQVTDTRPENACRDTLVGLLESKVAVVGAEVQSEARYADDKRSDIRVSYSQSGFNTPIEIKKSCHRDLWSAIQTQLIAKYTRDPSTDGYGIYLVFWFGEAEDCRPTPRSGPKPKSAAELDSALLDTLSDHERRKISVCVIDVSKPVA